MKQYFCEKCQRFLADRYVEGTCPYCDYHDARGDQCDKCGHTYNAIELKNPRCKLDSQAPIVRESRHMFLDLPKLQTECEKWVEESNRRGQWSNNGYVITKKWFAEGLQARCITRDLKWGTPVPLPEFSDKVFYVWFDACIGYISITANYTKQWQRWWKNPEHVQLYQFMGKDNVPFHTVVFPSSLIGTRDQYTMLHHISTTEYLNYEDGKFSKSRGTGVFGDQARETGIPADVWRYYLLANRPETSDTNFSWSDLLLKTNTELLANMGNFVNRSLSFIKAKYSQRLPAAQLGAPEKALFASVDEELRAYIDAMEHVRLRDGLRAAMNVSRLGNQYLAEQKLDNALFTNERARCDTVMAVCANLIYVLSALLGPFLPQTSTTIAAQLNAPVRKIPEQFAIELLEGHTIGTPAHLFKRLEEKEIDRLKAKFAGTVEAKPEKKKRGGSKKPAAADGAAKEATPTA